jgi:serine/threonine-protein kinase
VSDGIPRALAGFAAGQRIGGYLLEEQIGHGGMAVVFRARDERLGRQVALKILAPALAADEGFRHRFIRESRAAAAVDDPHIIPVFEAGEADGALFIAMRYVPDGDLRTLLFREGTLGSARTWAIVSRVATALDVAHAAGLVHRDVKPANMLLDLRQGRHEHVYLADFGLSKEALTSVGLTGTGLFLGTVDYAAPEQISGRPVDGRADQYALGCAGFEMLCGEPPYRRDQPMAVLHAHLSEAPPRVTARRAGLPAALDQVFARVLAKSPDDRFGTCTEFSDALGSALGLTGDWADDELSHPPTQIVEPAAATGSVPDDADRPVTVQLPLPGPPPAIGPEPRMRSRKRWPVAAASAAIAAVAVAAVVALTGLGQAPNPARHTGGSTPANGPAGGNGSSPPAPDNTWIAQLAAVPFAAGTAGLNARLADIRSQVPRAQVASSTDYASLTPGYWMIYYDGSFSDGTQALSYCASVGRTTVHECFGTFLSHNAADQQVRCYPGSSGGPPAGDCYHKP